MPDLAARPFVLAVEVNPGVGHPREQVVQPLVERHRRCLRGAQHVGHHRQRRDGVGGAERVVQHRPQMLLELAGARAVHGPVPGVVWTHRQLVDQQLAVDGFEQLDGQQTDHAEFVGQPQRQLLSCGTRRHRAAPGPARSPSRRCRRAGPSRPPARPRPARTASAPPAPRARDASRPAPRPIPLRRNLNIDRLSRGPRPRLRPSAPRDRRNRRGPP